MGIAALMLTSGVFLIMAGIKDQSVPAIIADVIGGRSTPAGLPVQAPQTGTGPINGVPGTGTGAAVLTAPNGSPQTIGGGYVGRSNRAPGS